ncbi:TonB-dependent receptor [Achromobacter sp. UMC46]|uniref:TonB-dependent siderophore receptor n=1 Tax=Achromobacter sp. UMC46 TaxID=1862319 RepID=UPI0016015400|nr:TonB-dependent receptor [Achromobacter sp. UMC46]
MANPLTSARRRPAAAIAPASFAVSPVSRALRIGWFAVAVSAVLPLGSRAFAQATAADAATQTDVAARTLAFQVPAGPLPGAIAGFAEAAGVSVSAPPELVRGLASPGVNGAYPIRQGLERLLAGTGLVAVPSGADTWILRRQPSSSAADAAILPEIQVEGRYHRSQVTEGSGSYLGGPTDSSTGLTLSLRETPQSVSIITRQQMDDQGLLSIADVLQQTPGVTVAQDNTQRYAFSSRGFSLDNFQYDGLPSLSTSDGSWDTFSTTSTAIYDRIEVVRGASGLLNGTGYPSGSVNLVRKRPTRDFQGQIAMTAGSWDRYRGEVDLSSPLSESGGIRGRVVAAQQNRHAFFDYYQQKERIFYGIVEADLTPSTLLSLGLDHQENEGTGSSWTHIPLFFSDGTRATFPRSFSPAAKWGRTVQESDKVFATLDHQFSNDWQAKVALGYKRNKLKEALISNGVGFIDADTHSMLGYTSQFPSGSKEKTIDLQLRGPFELGGRRHEAVVGWSLSSVNSHSISSNGVPTSYDIPDIFHWDNNPPRPTGYVTSEAPISTLQRAAYGTVRLRPTDALSLIAGARVNSYDWSQVWRGDGWQEPSSINVSGKVTPYAGVVYDVDAYNSVYASYTDIFKPLAWYFDRNNRQLDPQTGTSYEVGAKGEYFDGKLNTAIAVFQIKQSNVALLDPNATRPDGSAAYTAAKGVTSNGFELNAVGEVAPGWQVMAGYTYRNSKDATGAKVNTTDPEQLFKLATTYRFPGRWSALTIGGNVYWQSRIYYTASVGGRDVVADQKSYAIAGLMARYEFSRQLSASLNINNLFDKTYYSGLGSYGSAYYGEPRNALMTVNYKF